LLIFVIRLEMQKYIKGRQLLEIVEVGSNTKR
jgi:hypothetical protein